MVTFKLFYTILGSIIMTWLCWLFLSILNMQNLKSNVFTFPYRCRLGGWIRIVYSKSSSGSFSGYTDKHTLRYSSWNFLSFNFSITTPYFGSWQTFPIISRFCPTYFKRRKHHSKCMRYVSYMYELNFFLHESTFGTFIIRTFGSVFEKCPKRLNFYPVYRRA